MKNTTNRKIKALIFDLVGVLVVKKNNYYKDHLVEEIDGIIGDVTNDDLFRKNAMNEYDLDDKSFERLFDRISDKYEIFKPIWELLPDLKKQYKLAIITNGTRYNSDLILNNSKIEKFFDEFISSSDEGVTKPDPKIYEVATEKLAVDPENCLFIDDSKDNIEGARKLGMKTLHWKKDKKNIAQIAELL